MNVERPEYYGRDGKPIRFDVWRRLYGQLPFRFVARTELPGCVVSTIWLGLDHSFGFGPPLIFETMIFGGPLDETQDRYSSEPGALRGHVRWTLDALRAWLAIAIEPGR